MISYVELQYQKSKTELYSGDISSPLDTRFGRCYSIIPTLEMIKKGIRAVELGLSSLTWIFIHTPGVLQYESNGMVLLRNVMEVSLAYLLHSVTQMKCQNRNPKIFIFA